MFFLRSKYRLSEWARQSLGERERAEITTVFIFPKPIPQSALNIPRSISLGFITGDEVKEKWESLAMRLPHPKLYHYFLSAPISSLLTYKFAASFLATVPSLHLLYCLPHANADREIRFQIQTLRIRLLSCLLWCPLLPSLICLFCLECLFTYFYLIQYVQLLPSNWAKEHMWGRMKTELCGLAKSCSVQLLLSVYKIAKHSAWKQAKNPTGLFSSSTLF